MRLRLVQWNIGHRTRQIPIPVAAVQAIRAMAPDVLVLTEYVDGPSRPPFLQELRRMGLEHGTLSEQRIGQNQVLVLTNRPHDRGLIEMTRLDDAADVNFVSVQLAQPNLGLVALRVPTYEKSSERNPYWMELLRLLRALPAGFSVVIGDMNTDPHSRNDVGARALQSLAADGWRLANPSGAWSYIARTGARHSRIDHVACRGDTTIASAEYIDRIDGVTLAAPMPEPCVSDHAALVVELDVLGSAGS